MIIVEAIFIGGAKSVLILILHHFVKVLVEDTILLEQTQPLLLLRVKLLRSLKHPIRLEITKLGHLLHRGV